ncbi:MAG: 23S rRNA (uracil(1939)-C(5))-methyltransferase RlmD [Lachnospiraceae bacterium]|nr:23S rRNA (uracil(1939)-C(5))-methyltransferase RlmD [Lachnospiraceae bacterium]
MTYVKNQILNVEITDMSETGEGIGKVDGYTLFVKDAIIGDVVKAGLTKVKKNYAFARVVEIITASKDRIDPPCQYHRQCGGCQIMAMSYDAQLQFKANKVKNDLVRIGGFDRDYIDNITEQIIGMENPLRYRNKAQYPVGLSKDGQIITGFYAGRTHSIIPNTNCYLGVEENKKILEIIIKYMSSYDVSPYDETTGKGIVRHILIRKGFTTGEIMVCVVINADSLKNSEALVSALNVVDGIKSICININKKNTNVILGDKCKTLWGEDTITDYIGDVKFKIGPMSFFQVNPVQTKKLYDKAMEYVTMDIENVPDSSEDKKLTTGSLTGKNVWDLYCGIGTISLFLAKKAEHVTGVEIVSPAIEDAKENAKLNGIDNAEFYVGAAEDLASELLEKGNIPDVIVVDPPRKGCDEKLLNTILSVKPERVVYVSCDPATLSRDLKILCGSNEYELKQVCPVDQFPHSTHVETVVLMSRTK